MGNRIFSIIRGSQEGKRESRVSFQVGRSWAAGRVPDVEGQGHADAETCTCKRKHADPWNSETDSHSGQHPDKFCWNVSVSRYIVGLTASSSGTGPLESGWVLETPKPLAKLLPDLRHSPHLGTSHPFLLLAGAKMLAYLMRGLRLALVRAVISFVTLQGRHREETFT